MIGSFWNLCRACPSMPVDKLHSEYRSTYRWHEYTGGAKPEIIRRPPVPNQFASSTDHFFSKSTEDERPVEGSASLVTFTAGPINEPPLPRRKKCPELAYRTTHEFVPCDTNDGGPDKNVISATNRARSEERGTPSRRSKSEGPPGVEKNRSPPTGRREAGVENVTTANNAVNTSHATGKAGESSGLFKKTISKFSTEYRLQFVWPNLRNNTNKRDPSDVAATERPRKSFSMGAIKASQTNALAAIHKKRTANVKEAAIHELEPLVNNVDENMHASRGVRGSHYEHEGRATHRSSNKEKFGFASEKADVEMRTDNRAAIVVAGSGGVTEYGNHGDSWYKDVVELRKKAGEYKCRGWGTEIDPELHKKQKDLWDQVSRRSSLSALSLATSVPRPITKEEKEKENNKKSSPTKGVGKGRFPGSAQPVDNRNQVDGSTVSARFKKDFVRHHLERTTGPDVEEGALLPSPTRDKLMPTIPRSKEDSPKKSSTSRHGSPQKGSPQKGSPKKMTKGQLKGRSQSVGPTVNESGSPKRQIRSGSTVANAAAVIPATVTTSSTPTSAKPPKNGERRPRPTTLSTSIHSRSKSSSTPSSGYYNRANSVPGAHLFPTNLSNDQQQLTKKSSSPSNINVIPILQLRKPNTSTKSNRQQRPKSMTVSVSTLHCGPVSDAKPAKKLQKAHPRKQVDADKRIATESADDDQTGEKDISSASPLPAAELIEHIIKSPPEPTRVKSPEQIIMRSPDPVNWTVPLDTGKTFTVTQNVRDGDPMVRAQSELKAATPIADKPSPVPLSAPPELAETEHTIQAEDAAIKRPPQVPEPPEIRYDKPVPGSTLRCLDDPIFEMDPTAVASTSSAVPNRDGSNEILEKAHDRFDRFWGGTTGGQENEHV